MAKTQRGFRCTACGWETAAFAGRCARCNEWNTLEPYAAPARAASGGVGIRANLGVIPAATISLADVPDDQSDRVPTGIPEFDRVLGGGLVPGSLVLVGGDPGIGKSTLMLQAAARIAGAGGAVAYVCGEESPRQVALRATRLGLDKAKVTLVPDTNLDAALEAAASIGAVVTIVDSIQAVSVEGLESRAGGPAQLAESGARLVAWAKHNGIATIVTGHVTKGGDIAGPRLLEHLVDAVLYFEHTDAGALRLLRAVKNRFGATDEVGVFEMTGEGLRSVENASSAFLAATDPTASGCAVTAVIEGSRPLAVEIQALAVPSFLASPRRIAAGIEAPRLHLLLAVLARRGGINAGNLDVVATVSGGLRLRDPAADLAALLALASAVRDQPLPAHTAYLGEVALSGAMRPAPNAARRLAELARQGMKRAFVPAGTKGVEGIALVPVSTVKDAIEAALGHQKGAPREDARAVGDRLSGRPPTPN